MLLNDSCVMFIQKLDKKMAGQVCNRKCTVFCVFEAAFCLGMYMYTFHTGTTYLQKNCEYTGKLIRQKNSANTTEEFQSNGCFGISWNLKEELISLQSAYLRIINSTGLQEHRLNKSFDQSMIHGGKAIPETCKLLLTKTKFEGRLGNQMFQYSSLLGMACEFDYIPIIDGSASELQNYFDTPYIADLQLKDLKIVECIGSKYAKYYDCSSYLQNQSEGIFDIDEKKFLQSWKYFSKCSSIIKTALQLKQKHVENAIQFLSANTAGWNTTVCVHVRRGDMTFEASRNKGYIVANVSYIQKAQQYFEHKFSSVIFIVLSDDMSWCKQNLKRNTVFSPFDNPGDDMALMTLCDHVIVTTGTFGWWGAWLSGGTTVYLKQSVRENSTLDEGIIFEDYYPPQWIPM